MMRTQQVSPQKNLKVPFEPAEQPIIGACSLSPIHSRLLNLDFIRAAFQHTKHIHWQVEPIYEHAFIHQFEQHPQSVRAAVCVAIMEKNNELYVLFTKRAENLLHHAGQVSFPGGRVDSTDQDAVAAALRETHEEVGIEPCYVEPLAEQPIFLTNTQFAMRPVVSLVHEGYRVQPNPCEVAEVFTVPLAKLMNPKQHRIHQLPTALHSNERVYFSMQWEEHFIWGATAAVVRNLYHYLSAAQKHLGA